MARSRIQLVWLVLATLAFASCGGAANTTTTTSGNATQPTSTTGTGAPETTESSALPIRVGIAVSLSGNLASVGQDMLQGLQLWVDEGNTILDREIELVVLDDESTPETSARLFERLISVENVDLVVGPYGSGPSAAVAAVTDRFDKFVIMPGASATTVFTNSRMAVQLLSPQRHLPALPLELAAAQGYRTVATAAVDNPYGRDVVTGVQDYAGQYGMEVVHDEFYEVDPRDLSSLMLNLIRVGADVVYVGAEDSDSRLFMRQAQEQNLNADMFILGPVGPVVPEFVEDLGETSEYVFGTAQWLPGAPYEGAAEFEAAFESAHGRKPNYLHATGYGALELLAELAERIGGLDDQALLEAANDGTDLETILGPFSLDDDGVQEARRGITTQIQDGQIVAVYPEGTGGTPRLPTPEWSDR